MGKQKGQTIFQTKCVLLQVSVRLEMWQSLCWCFQKAEAQLAYELQAAKEQQKIRLEEIEIQVVQRKKQIAIEEREIDRTDKELIAIVKRPAEAEAYKMQQLAEGQKWVRTLHLRGCSVSFVSFFNQYHLSVEGIQSLRELAQSPILLSYCDTVVCGWFKRDDLAN